MEILMLINLTYLEIHSPEKSYNKRTLPYPKKLTQYRKLHNKQNSGTPEETMQLYRL